MKIVVAGGTGLLGTALIKKLTAAGHAVTVLTRDSVHASKKLGGLVEVVAWDGEMPGPWEKVIDGADVVVNLAGESIGKRRWKGEQKERIVNSRINATRVIVQAIVGAEHKPSTLINASAVGYYGDVPEGEVDEAVQAGNDFLAVLCKNWEEEAYRAELSGVRVVMIRSGLVLTPKGGALGKLLAPFRLFAGGPLGSGRQWWPWIHIDDEIGIILHAIEFDQVKGSVNATAPSPVRMSEFAAALGRVLHRPAKVPTPAIALRVLLGEMADVLLLSGQRAIPKKMIEAGYQFKYVSLEPALVDLLGK